MFKLKNDIFAFTALFLVLVGCSQHNVPLSEKKLYDNTHHVVGKKKDAIKTVNYVEKLNNRIVNQVTFYIDKFPYRKKINLCQQVYSQNKNAKFDIHQCDGYVYITKSHVASYDLTFPKSSEIKNNVLLLYSSNISVSGAITILNSNSNIQAIHESNWYFK